MPTRPVIFISAVSGELRSARQLVANTLTFLGYEPEWQDIFGMEEGDLRAMLRRRIDASKGVLQMVGECYGAEPPSIDQQFGRVSYTQYEALYAASKGKRVWYLFLETDFRGDPHEQEDGEKRKLQAAYRERLKADAHLYHPLSNKEGLEASVLKLRDDLTRLRRGARRWAAFVAVLLVLIVGLSIWLLQGQRHATEEQRHASEEQRQVNEQLQAKVDKLLLLQGVDTYAEVQNKVRQEQPKEKPGEIEERTYEELGKRLGLDAKTLKERLPLFAQELKKSPNATTYERANAAYLAKDYNEAERLALAAADEAKGAVPPKLAEALKAFELAAWSAENRIQYADALDRLREAEKLTDRARDPLDWAHVQFEIAYALYVGGNYREAEPILREVLKERERSLGPEHPDSLRTRNNLAAALNDQGKYREAETEYRAVLAVEERILGPEHADTLATRNNLANLLEDQGKYAEAETEYRAVLALEEKVLGPEHPDTLALRDNLANVLDEQGEHAEAQTEYRAVLAAEERVLGPEHPDTLKTRNNLAGALDEQGKHAEAETEFRAVLALREKVLGPEHPDTLRTHNNLGNTLDEQGKHGEAETVYRAVLTLREKVLGPEHPDTLRTRNDLATTLDEQGRHAEAETEFRAVLALREKILGPEHPDTLATRGNFAVVLVHQGKYAEAETEYRTVLALREKVLGPEHADTLLTCFNLALCLGAEKKTQQAIAFAQRAADGAVRSFGPEHPYTKRFEQLCRALRGK